MPRIVRRRRAIELISANDGIRDFEKIQLFKLFADNSNKVETCLALENLSLMTRVLKDWAAETVESSNENGVGL